MWRVVRHWSTVVTHCTTVTHCDTGSADDVISLFDSFKEATLPASASKKSPTKKQTQSSKNVDKLQGALSVPSSHTQVSDGAAPNETVVDDDAKLFALAAKAVMEEDA